MAAKIPATVITGFLGAGKTTLIRHMLTHANGRRIALIINEFGDLGVDGGILKGCGIEGCADDDVMELSNGCICCTVAEDFVPTLEKLLSRDVPPDHIVIEGDFVDALHNRGDLFFNVGKPGGDKRRYLHRDFGHDIFDRRRISLH